MKEECSKFGKVVHISVDKESKGHVYLKFDKISSAEDSVSSLNGRFFAGKTVSHSFFL